MDQEIEDILYLEENEQENKEKLQSYYTQKIKKPRPRDVIEH